MKVLLRSIDLETRGLEPPEAEVIEIGWTDIVFDTETKTCEVGQPEQLLFAPTKPLTPENMAIHHIRNDMVAGLEPCTEAILRAAVNQGDPAFIVAHNWAFESKWFTPEILGAAKPICTLKCALRAWEEAPAHGNQVLRYWLDLPLSDLLAFPPHRAGPDSYVTAFITAALVKTETVNDLVRWTREPRYYATCPLTKHKGQKWENIPADYLVWCLTKATDLDADIKAACQGELDRRRGGPR